MTSSGLPADSDPAHDSDATDQTPSTLADWPIRDYIADGTTAEQVARGFLRENDKSPVVITIYVILLVAAFFASAAVSSSWIIAGITAAVIPVMFIALNGRPGTRGRAGSYARKLQNVYGAGLLTQVQLRERSLWIKNAVSEGTTDYSAFKTAKRNGEAVLVKTGQTGVTIILPGQLFSEEDLTELQRRINAASPQKR